ncbi:UNVERIFIED_CONTAM: hypothetical protein K2H54_048594 [Gekko kuhli]
MEWGKPLQTHNEVRTSKGCGVSGREAYDWDPSWIRGPAAKVVEKSSGSADSGGQELVHICGRPAPGQFADYQLLARKVLVLWEWNLVDGVSAGTILVFVLIGLIISVGFCFSPWGQRLARRCAVLDWSSTSSRDGDDGASLSSDQAEATEDALKIQGLSSANQRQPVVVKFRRGKPGNPDDPPVSSAPAPGDVLEL